jgi:hypothetical protein
MATPTTVTIPGQTGTIRSDLGSWHDLVKAIEEQDGVALVPMEQLRRLEGAQRLGVHVLKSISGRLATLGLGHMPDTLPNRQDQEAILYRYGTPASDVIVAIREGLRSVQDVRNTYRALHKLNALPDIDQVVHRDELDERLQGAAAAVLDLLGPAGRSAVFGGMLEPNK